MASIFAPAKIDHQKLAIRKKSTFFRFSIPNFNTQLVIPISLHKKNLVKIGVRLPPEIKVQTEMELGGTYGMCVLTIWVVPKLLDIVRNHDIMHDNFANKLQILKVVLKSSNKGLQWPEHNFYLKVIIPNHIK